MIVIDNSALIEAVVAPDGVGAAVVRRIEGADLAAPELLDVEAVSTLRGLVRAGTLSTERAQKAIRLLGTLDIERVSHRLLVPRMWELRDSLTAYDAAYVALAELLGAPLLTGDRRWLDVPGLRCTVEVFG